MENNWKQRLTENWDLMRIIRAALAIIVLFEAWKSMEIIFAVMGGILLLQAVMNVGCCGSAGCGINTRAKKDTPVKNTGEEVTFEEIN